MYKKTKKRSLLILGAGLFGEEIASLAEDTGKFEVCGFVEGVDRDQCDRKLLGKPVIWIDEIEKNINSVAAVCAVGSSSRKEFIEQVASPQIVFTSIIHPSAQLSHGCILGEGAIICAGSIIATKTTIGNHVIINRGCLIGHHNSIGDYVTISPGANIAAKVHIGNSTYIGMGAIILDGISIGSNSIVGAGALVTRDVPDNVLVMGLPAKIVKNL